MANDSSSTIADIEDLTGKLTETALESINGANAVISGGDLDVLVKFTTVSEIPSTGSIFIEINADYSSVYSDCRSYVTKSADPSALFGNILDASKKSGSLYC